MNSIAALELVSKAAALVLMVTPRPSPVYAHLLQEISDRVAYRGRVANRTARDRAAHRGFTASTYTRKLSLSFFWPMNSSNREGRSVMSYSRSSASLRRPGFAWLRRLVGYDHPSVARVAHQRFDRRGCIAAAGLGDGRLRLGARSRGW
jgi:hypothetical protein